MTFLDFQGRLRTISSIIWKHQNFRCVYFFIHYHVWYNDPWILWSLLSSCWRNICILLCGRITADQLYQAENNLNLYYAQFPNSYGVNNCTINLHNACQHLASYVKKLGPLWAWSCFAFGDINKTILKCAHGTGDWLIVGALRPSSNISAIIGRWTCNG